MAKSQKIPDHEPVPAMSMTAESPSKGKKRTRKDKDSTEDKPRKRVKSAVASETKVKVVSVKKTPQSKPKTSKVNEKDLTTIQHLKWRTLQAIRSTSTDDEDQTIKESDLRPRIWTNSREELLAMMPEMSGSKCTNGISWLLYETPMLMLDESIRCFEISREGMDSSSLDLVTTRAFVCPLPQGSNLESPSVKINPPPEPFEAPSAKDLSSEEKPKFRRRAPRYASPKLPKRTNISDTSQGGTRIDFDKRPTSSNIQKAEDASTGSHSGRAAGLDENKISPPSLSNISSPSSIIADPMSSLCLPSALTLSVPAITRSTPRFLSSSIPDNSKLIKFESASASIDNFLDSTWKKIAPPSSKAKTATESNSGTWRAPVISPRDASVISIPSKPNNVIATSENPGPHQSASELSISTRQFHQLPALPMNTAGSLDGGDMNIEREFSQKLPPKMHLRHLFKFNMGDAQANLPYPNHRDGPQSLLSDMKKESSPSAERPNLIEHPTPHPDPLQSVPQTSMPVLPSEKMLAINDAKLLTGAEDANAQGSSIMIGEDGNAMNLVASDQTQPVTDPQGHFSEYVPSPIPEELQALIDSYLFGRPLTIIIFNRRLKDHWSLQLPEEFGYAMLGYFRILGVQETRLQFEDNKGSVNELRQSLSGQVQWRFRLKWAAGGEESILPKRDNVNFDHPWWNPPSVLLVSTSGVEQAPEEKVPETALDDLDDPENYFPTTARYRTARLSHHEYKFRHHPLSELYSSVIPLHLLVPYGIQVIDNSFPRGWFCKDCGRMNFQAALRHRKCPSSFCKDKQPSVPPYARDLIWIRDPQERLPLSAPLNVIPRSLPTKLGKFKDGTQTFSYYISERPSIFIKHIFTSNIPRLQEHANIFLRDIQLNVPLIRPMAENTPYFMYTSRSPKDNTKPTTTKWSNLPTCINQAKEAVVHRARWFGELKEEQLAVNRLRLLAWVTSGSKRGRDLIRAKQKCVTVLALGCTVVLIVTPRSLGGPIAVEQAEEGDSSQLRAGENDEEEEDTGWIAGTAEDDGVAEEPTESPKKGKAAAKAARPNFVISLVHGDIVVFYGDDFEYSVKRDGTSLLLIASHEDHA